MQTNVLWPDCFFPPLNIWEKAVWPRETSSAHRLYILYNYYYHYSICSAELRHNQYSQIWVLTASVVARMHAGYQITYTESCHLYNYSLVYHRLLFPPNSQCLLIGNYKRF